MIQNELFHLGSDLCFLEDDKVAFRIPQIESRHVEALERLMDELNEIVGPIENFVLPGGAPGAAHLHVARTVCRRAEREAIALARGEKIGTFVIPYLNRLSDALFVMARYENHQRGIPEPLWDSTAVTGAGSQDHRTQERGTGGHERIAEICRFLDWVPDILSVPESRVLIRQNFTLHTTRKLRPISGTRSFTSDR